MALNETFGEARTAARPRVCLVGGPDVDARLGLMVALGERFEVSAAGTEPALAARFAAHGLRFHRYRMSRGVSPLGDLRALWQLVVIFRAERPAIVHTFDTKPGVWGRLAAVIAGVPVVVGTLPGLGSLYAAPGLKARLARLVYQPLQRLACRRSQLTMFQNGDDAEEFVARGIVERGRSAVIPGSGVETGHFEPAEPGAESLARTELVGSRGGVLVVMVSRVMRAKGVLEFAAAARVARAVDPTLTFLLVGAEDAESIDALTPRELEELRGSLTWLGRRDDVKEILELADVFVFPSFYREGIPRVLLEAASMGLPLVAADVAGSREVIEEGVNGFLVPPRDPAAIAEAVLRLAGAPELRRQFGARSRARARERFDLSVVAERTGALYAGLLAAAPAGRRA
jgi:glycosyltransferase involved in cell wall biosynthesis